MSEWYNKTNFRSDKFLNINSLGVQKCTNKDYTIIREKGRVDFHILYVSHGQIKAYYEGNTYILNKGDLILYMPGQKQMYEFCVADSPESYWIHFTGVGAEELLNRSNLYNGGIYHVGSSEFHRLFKAMVREYYLKKVNYIPVCESMLYRLVALIPRLSQHSIDEKEVKYKKIYEVMEYMHNNYSINSTVTDYAGMCGLSPDRFAHLFREVTDVSPHRYITNIRIERARYLLKNTNLNVCEIALSVGMSDPLYFSRIFKKYTGISPSEYKKSSDKK